MKNNFDMICLSEIYLDSSIQHDDEKRQLNRYKLLRANNTNNNKRGGAGIYLKEFLATHGSGIDTQVELNNLNECIVFKVCTQHKKGYIISLYRSPSQTHDEFDDFVLDFEQVVCDITARSPIFVLMTVDFKARTAKWWNNDTSTTDGTKIDSITTLHKK